MTGSDADALEAALDAAVVRLRPHWAYWWPAADLETMAVDVRERLRDAVETLALRDAHVLAGGNVAAVLAARYDGDPVVVKASPRGHDDAQVAAEGEALAFWRPTGAVPDLVARRDDGFTLVLERLTPGTTLDETDPAGDERLSVLGRLVARLHAAGPPPPRTFPSLHDYAAGWHRSVTAAGPLHDDLEELLESADDDVLVHADLHGANALRAGEEWKAIDPHAVRGERHADTWALLDPLAPMLPADPAAARRTAWRRVARYADAAGLDPTRAAAWTRLRARAEALTIREQAQSTAADRAWAGRLRRLVDALG